MSGLEKLRLELRALIGLPLWGLRRSIGSSIFIEMGDSIIRPGETVEHGYYHFLLQLMSWRIFSCEALIVGSDSPPALIDREFSHVKFGNIRDIVISGGGAAFSIEGTGDISLSASWNGLAQDEMSNAWILFLGIDRSWAFSTNQVLSVEPQ